MPKADSTSDQDADPEENSVKAIKIASLEKAVHNCTEQKIKINDLQNFVFQNTKYLLQNYPEYGKELEYVEPTLIYILQKEMNLLESKRLLLEMVSH